MQAKKRAKSVTFGKKPPPKPAEDVIKESASNVHDVKHIEHDEKASDKVVEEILSKASATHEDEPKKSDAVSKSNLAEADIADEKNIRVEESVVEVISISKEKDDTSKHSGEPKEESSLEESLKSLRTEESEEEAKAEDHPHHSEFIKHSTDKEEPAKKAPQPEEPFIPSSSKDSNDEQVSEPKADLDSDVPATSFFAESPRKRTSGKRGTGVFYFIAVAFVSFVLGLGVMWGVSYGMKNPPSFNLNMDWLAAVNPSPTATPEPTPKPTEVPVDLSESTIQVLNGSGISGKAASLKTSLEDAGFTVSSTGNADLDDYTKTQVRAKNDVSEGFLKKLKSELEKDYVLDSKQGLSPTGEADVIVIIGSETAQ